MRALDLDHVPCREIAAHGSVGFRIGALVPQGTEAGVAVASLAAGGVIGRHPAVGEQVLVVLRGEVEVAGGDGVAVRLGPGRAVAWVADEPHETRALTDALLLLVEGDLELADGD